MKEALLLEGILSCNGGRRRARTLAAMLLKHFRSLARVLSAAEDVISSVPGVTGHDAAVIRSAYATVLESVTTPLLGEPLTDEKAIVTMALWTIGQSLVEQVQLVCLDGSRAVIGSEVICSGSERSVSVTSRTIILSACRRGAKAIIVAHNHPGGDAEPSDDDLRLTRHLSEAARYMDVVVLDHIIVASPKWFSFKAVGYL